MSKGPQNQTTTTRTEVDPTTRARQDVLWNTAVQRLGGAPGTGAPVFDPTQMKRRDGESFQEWGSRARQYASQFPNGPGAPGAPGAPGLDPGVLQYDPYTGQRFEGANDDMRASWEAARTAAGAGAGDVAAGGEVFRDLSTFQPGQVRPGQMEAFTADGSGPGSTATAGVAGARDVASKNFTDYDISKYLNPFIGGVVDTTLADIDRSRTGMIQSGQAAAARAGAYGGSRHGVADSLTNEAALRESASAAAGLRKAGFDTAAGLITGDANRDMVAQQSNQGADVATGVANANNATQASVANANLFNDLRKFNASQLQGASQFNTGIDFQGQTANQNAGIAGAGVRSGAATGMVNTGATKQAMAGKGADLLNRIGLQQNALGQQQRDFDFSQWQMGQMPDPYGKLNWLSGFTGTPGQSSTSTTPYHTSPFGQVAGAAATVLPFLI